MEEHIRARFTRVRHAAGWDDARLIALHEMPEPGSSWRRRVAIPCSRYSADTTSWVIQQILEPVPEPVYEYHYTYIVNER